MMVAWVWVVEAVGGLGYLLNRRLVARGEPVADVPTVLASLVRVLRSGKSDKDDLNDARSVAIAALRQSRGLRPCAAYAFETPPRVHRLENPRGVPVALCVDAAAARWGGPSPVTSAISSASAARRKNTSSGSWSFFGQFGNEWGVVSDGR